MPMYDKAQLAAEARKLHVVRDTLEKVYRLRDVLRFFDSSELLRNSLALKGGTAINMLFFNLPRLSVDIDLDFCENISGDNMIEKRNTIENLIEKHMAAEGYALSPKSKGYHSLGSLVYRYTNAGGMQDNLKIEINYSLRSHICPIRRMKMQPQLLDNEFEVNTVAAVEIYATKTVALITRAAARDLYDLNHMVRYGLFDEQQLELYRKCVIFYLAIATKTPILTPDYSAMNTITQHKIHTDLDPVIRDRDAFQLENSKNTVSNFLQSTLHMTEAERTFLLNFKNGKYTPELLFDDSEILGRIKAHPMALWKIKNNQK